MGTESEGGLAESEQQSETPPAHEQEDGQEQGAGAIEKEGAAPASSGDDPDGEVPKGVRKRIQRAVRDRDVEVGRRAAAEQERDELRERLRKYEPDAEAAKSEPKKRDPAPDAARNARLQDFTDDGEEKYDDFIEVVHENRRLRVTPEMADAMLEAENGIDIAYHLGKNPKEARRIASLGPIAQAKEIGKLEVSLAKQPEKKPVVKASKAPSPIEPVTGAKVRASNGLRADSPMEDFIKATR